MSINSKIYLNLHERGNLSCILIQTTEDKQCHKSTVLLRECHNSIHVTVINTAAVIAAELLLLQLTQCQKNNSQDAAGSLKNVKRLNAPLALQYI
mgnify:CR=1 FL=1